MKNSYQKGGPERYLDERGIRCGFGNLEKIRKERGWTQKEVAEKLYTNQQTISKHEQGLVIPSTAFVTAYANLYCVSVEVIIFG